MIGKGDTQGDYIMTHSRINSICEIICREAVRNVSEQHMQYSYAKMLLEKQVQMDASEKEMYIQCIADMLGV